VRGERNVTADYADERGWRQWRHKWRGIGFEQNKTKSKKRKAAK
jgi:hypothetical protein